MDFSLQTDPPEIAAFGKEVREWLQDNIRGSEQLRWSASWSTRENEEEYQFRRNLAGKLGKRAGCSRCSRWNMEARGSRSITRWYWKPSLIATASA